MSEVIKNVGPSFCFNFCEALTKWRFVVITTNTLVLSAAVFVVRGWLAVDQTTLSWGGNHCFESIIGTSVDPTVPAVMYVYAEIAVNTHTHLHTQTPAKCLQYIVPTSLYCFLFSFSCFYLRCAFVLILSCLVMSCLLSQLLCLASLNNNFKK